MDFGFPTIYFCPSCGKKMLMENYTSYTVSSSEYFSDGSVKESGICCAHFSPELSKCPHCKTLFFRGSAKYEETSFMTNTSKIKHIMEPGRDDLIDAVKSNIAKDWKEEKAIREMLWYDFNIYTRKGYYILSGDELKIWQDNCAALLPLAKKTLKEIQSKKKNEDYRNSDAEDCLFMIAELYRNLGKFDKCMEILDEFGGKWSWLKKQFAWECKAKNIFTFEVIPKNEMNLERAKDQYGQNYYDRAKYFLPPYYGRRNLKKAIADFKKAESLGMKGINFYQERGEFYLEELNDPDSAIADFNKALKQKDKDEWMERYISVILCLRSSAYLKKGNFKKALADVQTAINEDAENDSLYAARAEIHEAMGNVKDARNDRRMAEKVKQKNFERYEKQKKKLEAILKKPAKKIRKRPKIGEI